MVCLNSLVIAEDKLYAAVRAQLSAAMFIQEDHRILFEVIAEIRDAGGGMDGYILRNELESRGKLDDIGGLPYLRDILTAAPDPRNALQYAKFVIETHRLREVDRMIAAAHRAIRQPHGDANKAAQIIEGLQNDLATLVERSSSNDIHSLGDVMVEVVKSMKGGGAPRVATRIIPLDERIGGLGIGEMTLIAARPSMGKSLLGKQIADNLASKNVPIVYINCEENNGKTGRNWLSRNAKIANYRVRSGSLTSIEWAVADEWAAYSPALPFYLCDQAMTLSGVCNAITLAHARHGIRVAFVDYLQLIDAEGGDTREQEVSRISRRLKNLFKRLGIAGVVIAQLNRGNEAGQIRPPRLSDLRDSGQIEQDADVVLLIHRPDFYCREQGGQPTGKVTLIVAKNRDGSREGDVELMADLEHQEFREIVVEDPFA